MFLFEKIKITVTNFARLQALKVTCTCTWKNNIGGWGLFFTYQ